MVKLVTFILVELVNLILTLTAGKTAVLRALNAVLNYRHEEESFFNKAHRYAPRNNTYITIIFEDIPDKEIYENKIYDNKLTIKFSFSYADNKKKYLLV